MMWLTSPLQSLLPAVGRVSGFCPRKQKSPHQEQLSPHDTTFHMKANCKASNHTSPYSLGPLASVAEVVPVSSWCISAFSVGPLVQDIILCVPSAKSSCF